MFSRLISFALTSTCLLTAWSTAAEERPFSCERYACPQGLKSVSLCLTDPQAELDFGKRGVQWSCARRAIIRRGVDVTDLRSAFKEAAANCQRISDLRLVGHGTPIYQGAGRLTPELVNSLEDFSCVMAPGAAVRLLGCNNGHGCEGEKFMYSFAHALLRKGGTVTAATYYAHMIPGMQNMSMNGVSRTLYYHPEREQPEEWLLNILGFPRARHSKKPGEMCAAEIEPLLTRYVETEENSAGFRDYCRFYAPENRIFERLKQESAEMRLEPNSAEIFSGRFADSTALKEKLDEAIARLNTCVSRIKEMRKVQLAQEAPGANR